MSTPACSSPFPDCCVLLPNARLRRSSFHFLRYMGPQVVLLGIDMRSERTKVRILPEVGGMVVGKQRTRRAVGVLGRARIRYRPPVL